MEITSTVKDGNTSRVRIKGDLNIYNALAAKEQLAGALAGAENIELDLSNVTEFDSSGLQLLVLACKETERKGHRFVLTDRSEPVETVIRLFRLSEFFGGAAQEAQ